MGTGDAGRPSVIRRHRVSEWGITPKHSYRSIERLGIVSLAAQDELNVGKAMRRGAVCDDVERRCHGK
jgi:hypothetical protein